MPRAKDIFCVLSENILFLPTNYMLVITDYSEIVSIIFFV